MDELFDRIVLEGEGVTSLCSINVNGGRNVAIKQPTEQTSTNGTNVASNAVDGNTVSNFDRGTCTLTNNVTDTSSTWTLTFDVPMIVDSLEIIPRDEDPWRQYVSKSRIQIYDTNNENVFNYTYVNYWLIYSFTVNLNKVALKKLSITATTALFPTPILTFCEVNIFGDCQPGYWDLDCKKTCGSRCPTSCSVVDGSCTTRCLGYTDPPLCTNGKID
uniref:Fucolectin tachylectin-4 pentraxin-1 domain-containing protein n=1 Tax=Biomphalaria glabrata TaxID=6526 RepID=A0A2C9KWZ0_BIOGL